jgi:uncharacterized protein (TIGR02145 family)
MSENLKTSRYRNGGSVTYVVGDSDWVALTIGAWSYFDHNEAYNTLYGKLYNWYTTQGDTLCPSGWHIPSDEEWTILTNFLGGESMAGGKLKEVGNTNWLTPNTNATNESGFTALGAGSRTKEGDFLFQYPILYYTGYWSSTESSYSSSTQGILPYSQAYSISLYSDSGRSFKQNNGMKKTVGLSIRCIKNI